MNDSAVRELAVKVVNGYEVSKEDLIKLIQNPVKELSEAANAVRLACCGNSFDMCSIINVKNGRCPENCRFCAQSAHWNVNIEEYPFLDVDSIVKAAKDCAERGALRFSLVSSGRKLNADEIKIAAEAIAAIKHEVNIHMCASLGLLSEDEFKVLKDAGLSRVHNNIETSRRFWPQICTTHSYDQKIKAIKAAKAVGLDICSGGIIGLGETMEDRIDMALTLRELGVCSVPINVLNPIPGTPLQNNDLLSFEEILKTIALMRFALPNASIRLAGGRTLLPNAGAACFESGANATISGNMLTTAGYSFESDTDLVESMGFQIACL